jgi:hypothetical protein
VLQPRPLEHPPHPIVRVGVLLQPGLLVQEAGLGMILLCCM